MALADAHGGEWGYWPHPADTHDRNLSRRQARHMSRQFAEVGVGIDATRLREIATGAPASVAEWTDVEFAVIAIDLIHHERLAKVKRAKRQCVRGLLVVAMTLVVLGMLLSVTVLMLSLALHTTPFSVGEMWRPVIPSLYVPAGEGPQW
jgi:hypothetical protein